MGQFFKVLLAFLEEQPLVAIPSRDRQFAPTETMTGVKFHRRDEKIAEMQEFPLPLRRRQRDNRLEVHG